MWLLFTDEQGLPCKMRWTWPATNILSEKWYKSNNSISDYTRKPWTFWAYLVCKWIATNALLATSANPMMYRSRSCRFGTAALQFFLARAKNFAFWIFKTQLRIHMDMRVKLLSFCRQKYVIALSREKKSTLLLGQIQRIPALLCLRTRWRKTFFLKCILRFSKMAIARYARNLEKWAFFAWQVS